MISSLSLLSLQTQILSSESDADMLKHITSQLEPISSSIKAAKSRLNEMSKQLKTQVSIWIKKNSFRIRDLRLLIVKFLKIATKYG